MIINLLNHKLRTILKFRHSSVLSLSGLVIATSIFIVICHITFFERSFDKYHEDYKNIYRVQNIRIYKNLVDESAGCPPATCPVIQKEVADIEYAARIKPILNSLLSVTKDNQSNVYQHDNLYFSDNSIFKIFSFKFSIGNPEFALNEVNKAVVTKSFANKYFGNENILGSKFICKNNEATNEFTISAIIEDIPANSYLNFDCLLSFKTLEYNERNNRNMDNYWGWNAFNTFVKIKDNADTSLIHNQLAGMVDKYNLSRGEEMTRIFKLQPIEDIHLHSNLRHEIGRRNSASTINILLAISIFILLIAWINHINISTIKSRKELLIANVKRVLGSKRRYYFYEYLFESLFFNLFAVVFAIVLVFILSPTFNNLYNIELHSLKSSSWMIILASSFFLAFVSGLYPAVFQLGLSRINAETNTVKKETPIILRNGLVVFQFAVSIVFIIATSIVIKQIKLMELEQDKMGLENIVTIKSLTSDKSMQIGQKSFVDNVKSIPGIQKVSVSNSIPGGDYTNVAGSIRQLGITAENGIKCHFFEVNEDYFDLFNVKILAGEKFSNHPEINNNSVIINNTALKMLGFNEPHEAINKQIIMGELDNRQVTISGVINDFYHKTLDEPIHPTILTYQELGGYISVKYDNKMASNIIEVLRASWEDFFPDQPFEYNFNDKYYSAQYNNYRVLSRLVSTFALFIILVSCIGLYSLSRYSINNRIKEIGVRKVNGAKISEMIFMLNKNFLKWVITAFIIATPVAYYFMKKWLESFAFKTDISWWVFALAGAISLIIALVTVSFQSYRAASRNPVEALRYE